MSSLPRGLCGSPVWEADRVAKGRRVRHLGVLVSVAVLPLVASCSNDDEGRSGPEETPTTVEQATGLRDLVSALQDERSAAFVTITGVAAPSDGSVADADVRGTTDETLADLDPAVVASLWMGSHACAATSTLGPHQPISLRCRSQTRSSTATAT
jgi:hypothetical protein